MKKEEWKEGIKERRRDRKTEREGKEEGREGEGRRKEEGAGCLGRAALDVRTGMWTRVFLSTYLCLV